MGVVQIRLDFETFMIAQPVMGTCTNESLTITGMDAVTSKVLPMNLCGDLTGHMYSVCLADNDAYCDVALTSDMFSLSGTPGECKDAVSFGVTAYCTDTFANLGTLTWNYTGAYQIPIFTDGDNTDMKEGFQIDFIKLPC